MGDNHAETMTTAPFICGSCVTNIQQKGNSPAICFSEAPQNVSQSHRTPARLILPSDS